MEFNDADEFVKARDTEEDEYLTNRNILIRNYQIKLVEKAKKENTIIYLPTGAGKTLIALHVLCSKSNDIRRPYSEGGKRAFFVGITRVMVHQLYKVLRTHTKFKVAYFTGDMNTDNWNTSKWIFYFETNHVFVLTGEILRQILQLRIIHISKISFIVLDECHHAVADHPYRLVSYTLSILQDINQTDSLEKPLLLGLSSVLLNSCPKKNQAVQLIQSLERAFKGKVVTENISLEFTTNPKEKIIYYQKDSSNFETILQLYDDAIEVINSLILKKVQKNIIPEKGREFKNGDRAKRIKNALVQSKGLLEDLGMFGGSIAALFFIILFEKFRLLSNDPNEIQVLIYARTELNKIRHTMMKIMGEEESIASIIFFSSPKVQQLINIIKQIKDNFKEKHFSALVFVYQRATAVILSFLLKRLSAIDETFRCIKSNFAIGSSALAKEYYFSKNKNEDIVKQFDSHALNLLVATNLLEEGIDVSACNVVISFDFPKSYKSYYQSRGRARDRDSLHFLFLDETEKSEKLNALNDFKHTEEELFKSLRSDYDKEENEEDSVVDLENICLHRKSGNIILDGLIAIKIVHRYCSKLPQDKFSYLAPISWYTEIENEKKAFIQLPVNCPIREVIEGELKENARQAKRSAFLATVKKLYEIGELDESLNPKSFTVKEEDFKDLFPHFKKENIPKSLPQPGSRKRKNLYKAKFAECLSNCLPRPGVKTYVHVIEMTVAFEKPELVRKAAIYDILQIPVTFAILSSKRLFKIFQFPLFLDLGQINCDLLVNYDEIILTESELNDIRACHFTLFKKVIRLMKCYQVFDNRNKEHSFFVVPMEKNETGRFVLNWDLIQSDFCKNSNSALVRYNPTSNRGEKRTSDDYTDQDRIIRRKTSDSSVSTDALSGRFLWEVNQDQNNEEPKFIMTETDYKYFVIFPNYRKEDPPQCYIVNKFCHDMSPLSPFPNIFMDYFDYYKEKYSIEITNTKQPLLRVSPLYNCSNFNRPRNRKARRARERVKEFEEYLVPELCDVIPFDRRFWVKALLLPTIFNRIQHVYCVEEFRRKIVSETGLGLYELPMKTDWKPLEMINTYMNEEEADGIDSLNFDITTSLPLSKLKDKSQKNQKIILDPERNLYEVGLCDMEFYVNSLKEIDFEEELSTFEESSEVKNLIALKNIPVPTLEILKGGNSKFGPDLAQLVQACTSKSANDIVDYERLEILGDSFLKFATTVFLFKNFTENEGVLSSVKEKIVGNRNLLYCGLKKGIQNIINVTDFVPLYDWNPPLFYVPERLVDGIINNNIDPAVLSRLDISLEEQFSGVLSEDTLRTNEEILFQFEKCEMPIHSLLPFKIVDDKTVADCVESFIGAYLITLGLMGAFEFLIWLGILPKSRGSYSEIIEKPYNMRFITSRDETLVLNILGEVFYSDLEDVLNYRFKNKAFLLEAITHPSYLKNRVTDCYQRLELLGDAILDFLITIYVYENCGNLSPGQVTDIRASLVNNITFACLVVRYELYKYLLSFSSTLSKAIANFVSFQNKRNHVIDDEILILLESNDCMIAETIQVPKALGDLFESLAAAIYLDSGNSLETVWNVYYKLMKREIDTFTETVPKTAVRLLHEICGDKPYYETKIVGDLVLVSCSVYYENREIKAFGFGTNKKDGKRSAAKLVVNKILSLKR